MKTLYVKRSLVFITLLVTMVIFNVGCNITPLQQASHPLTKTFDAHGGLSQWKKHKSFTYTLNGFPLSQQVAQPNTTTVDLEQRLHRIDSHLFTAGYDGQQAWAQPNDKALGLPPRFYLLGSFYFIGMPFVFSDPGVQASNNGILSFRGSDYNSYKITFSSGVGHSEKDEYIILVNPQTNELALIHHSVSENPDVDRVTWVFNEWQEISGLKVPAKMTFYPGWNPTGNDPGTSFTIENVGFSQKRPSIALFKRPLTQVSSVK